MAYRDYSQYFSQAEQKYGLRPGTGSALMSLEDASGNPYAKSPAGAMGPLQLMPGTASDMGVKNPFDPAANIDGGLHYFSNILNNQAHGDYRTAAMGYNAGPNRSSFPSASQSYADQFVARLPQSQQTAQPGGQPQMPPQTGPMSLADLQNTPPMQSQAPSLGALAQSMPQGNIPAPHHSKFNFGNIAGVLGDAFSAYGGRQPTFGPMLAQEHMMQQQQGFEREKFNAELQMRMYAMTHPEDWMKAQMFSQLPTDQQYNIGHYEDVTNPVNVSTPQGTQNVPRTATKTVNGQTFYKIGSDWYQAGGQ